MDIRKSLMDECDLGIINGHITLNGAYHDAAAVRGLFAPPLFSDTFRLDIRFNGRRLPAQRCFWQPTEVRASDVRKMASGPPGAGADCHRP